VPTCTLRKKKFAFISRVRVFVWSKCANMRCAMQVKKTYVAIVYGHVVGNEGAVDLPMRPDPNDRPKQVVDLQGGKPAKTLWKVLVRGSGRIVRDTRPSSSKSSRSCTANNSFADGKLNGNRSGTNGRSNISNGNNSGYGSSYANSSSSQGSSSSDSSCSSGVSDNSSSGGSSSSGSTSSSAGSSSGHGSIPDFLGSSEASSASFSASWLDSFEGPWTRVELKPVRQLCACLVCTMCMHAHVIDVWRESVFYVIRLTVRGSLIGFIVAHG